MKVQFPSYFRASERAVEVPVCTSNAALLERLMTVRVVVKFMEENPAQLDTPFTLLTLMEFRDAWSCK
jgi:hypothetical protein